MGKRVLPYKWELVVILWFALFFHQADRQIFNVLLPSIRDDLGLSDSQMGLVSTIMLLTFGLMVPIAGIAGDRISKKKVIILSLLVWTSATLATGTSTTLLHLILLRSIATGGGEAFYSPSANSLISEYHRKTLSTALSVHQTALYVGVVTSSVITGYIADMYGWRMAFYVFGGGGVLLAGVIYLRLKSSGIISRLPDSPGFKKDIRKNIRQTIFVFFRKPTSILLAFAFAGMQFAGVGFMTWMPTLLHEKYGLSLAQSGFDSTFYYKACAFGGIIIGARIADTLSKRTFGSRGFVQLVGLVIGIPSLYFIGATDDLQIVYIALAVFGLCQGLYDSSIFATLYEVIELPYRSTATGIMLSFAFVIGSLSPYVLGLMKSAIGLSLGISFLSVGYFMAALCILSSLLFFFKRDRIS